MAPLRRLPDPFGIRPPGVQLPHGNRSPGEAFGKTMEDLGRFFGFPEGEKSQFMDGLFIFISWNMSKNHMDLGAFHFCVGNHQ